MVLGYISGEMRMYYLRILLGDKVTVKVDPLRFESCAHCLPRQVVKRRS